MSLVAALSRGDVAQYVDALFFVYLLMIIARIVLSWVQQFRPLPYNRPVRAVTGFLSETVDPYLNVFRRFIPPIGGGGFALDLSPILAIILLTIVQGVVVSLIAG
jgi:YggT family protein